MRPDTGAGTGAFGAVVDTITVTDDALRRALSPESESFETRLISFCETPAVSPAHTA